MKNYIGRHKYIVTDMEIKEEKLLEIFSEIFTDVDKSEITLDSEFREWDQYSSLTQVELIARIEEEFQVKVKLLPMVKAETISDVLEAIQES